MEDFNYHFIVANGRYGTHQKINLDYGCPICKIVKFFLYHLSCIDRLKRKNVKDVIFHLTKS